MRNLSKSLILSLALGFGCQSSTPGAGDEPGAPGLPWDIVEPADTTAPVCATASASVVTTTPTVALVVDQSGSMTSNFGGMSRWAAVRKALMDPTDGLVSRLENDVRFGFYSYSSEEGYEGGSCPMMQTIAPRLDNYDAINGLYSTLSPIEDTPTGPAIEVAHDALLSVTDEGPKAIVLGTDGLPDTCEVPDPDGLPDAQIESVLAVEAAYHSGISTYVISVGPEVAQSHLQDMANAGVGMTGEGDDAPYYVALDDGDLVDVFDRIIDGVRYCVIPLDIDVPIGGPEGYQLADGTVTLDGRELTEGQDWRLRNDHSVELLGATCDEVLAGGDHDIDVEFTCEVTML